MKLYAAAFLSLSALSSCAAYDDALEDSRLANRNGIYDDHKIVKKSVHNKPIYDIEMMSKTGRILKKQRENKKKPEKEKGGGRNIVGGSTNNIRVYHIVDN